MSSLKVNRDELDGIISYFRSLKRSLNTSLRNIRTKARGEAALNIMSSLIYIPGVEDGDAPIRDFRSEARAYVDYAKAIVNLSNNLEPIEDDFESIINALESVDKLVDTFEAIPVYLPGQSVTKSAAYGIGGVFFSAFKEELTTTFDNNGKVEFDDIVSAYKTSKGITNEYINKTADGLLAIKEMTDEEVWDSVKAAVSGGVLCTWLNAASKEALDESISQFANDKLGLGLLNTVIDIGDTLINDEDVPLASNPIATAISQMTDEQLEKAISFMSSVGEATDKFTNAPGALLGDVVGEAMVTLGVGVNSKVDYTLDDLLAERDARSKAAEKRDEKELADKNNLIDWADSIIDGAQSGAFSAMAGSFIGITTDGILEKNFEIIKDTFAKAADKAEAIPAVEQTSQNNTNGGATVNKNTQTSTQTQQQTQAKTGTTKTGGSKPAAQTQQPQPAQQAQQPAQQTQQPAQQTQQPVQNNPAPSTNPEPQQQAPQQQETVQREIVRNTGDVRPTPSPTPKPSVPDPTPVVKTEPSQESEAATSLGDILDEALGDNKEAKVGLAATVAGAGAVMGGKVDVVSSLPDVSGIELPSTTGMNVPTATTSTVGPANVQSGSSSEFINSLTDTSASSAGTTGSANGMSSASGDGKVYNNNTFADSLEKSTQEANSQNQTNTNKSSNNATNLASENKDDETKKFGKSKNNSYGSTPDDDNQDDEEKKLSKQHQEAPEDENEEDKNEEKATKEKKNKAETIGGASGYLMPADETVAQVAVGVTVGGAIISALLKALKIINWIAFILLILALILLYTTYRFTHKKIIEKRKKQYLITLEKINKEQDNMVDVSDAISESTVASKEAAVVQNSDSVNEQQTSAEATVTVDSSNTVGSGENIEQSNMEETTEEPRQDLIIPPMKDNPNYEEFGTGLDFMQPDEEQQVDRQN